MLDKRSLASARESNKKVTAAEPPFLENKFPHVRVKKIHTAHPRHHLRHSNHHFRRPEAMYPGRPINLYITNEGMASTSGYITAGIMGSLVIFVLGCVLWQYCKRRFRLNGQTGDSNRNVSNNRGNSNSNRESNRQRVSNRNISSFQSSNSDSRDDSSNNNRNHTRDGNNVTSNNHHTGQTSGFRTGQTFIVEDEEMRFPCISPSDGGVADGGETVDRTSQSAGFSVRSSTNNNCALFCKNSDSDPSHFCPHCERSHEYSNERSHDSARMKSPTLTNAASAKAEAALVNVDSFARVAGTCRRDDSVSNNSNDSLQFDDDSYHDQMLGCSFPDGPLGEELSVLVENDDISEYLAGIVLQISPPKEDEEMGEGEGEVEREDAVRSPVDGFDGNDSSHSDESFSRLQSMKAQPQFSPYHLAWSTPHLPQLLNTRRSGSEKSLSVGGSTLSLAPPPPGFQNTSKSFRATSKSASYINSRVSDLSSDQTDRSTTPGNQSSAKRDELQKRAVGPFSPTTPSARSSGGRSGAKDYSSDIKNKEVSYGSSDTSSLKLESSLYSTTGSSQCSSSHLRRTPLLEIVDIDITEKSSRDDSDSTEKPKPSFAETLAAFKSKEESSKTACKSVPSKVSDSKEGASKMAPISIPPYVSNSIPADVSTSNEMASKTAPISIPAAACKPQGEMSKTVLVSIPAEVSKSKETMSTTSSVPILSKTSNLPLIPFNGKSVTIASLPDPKPSAKGPPPSILDKKTRRGLSYPGKAVSASLPADVSSGLSADTKTTDSIASVDKVSRSSPRSSAVSLDAKGAKVFSHLVKTVPTVSVHGETGDGPVRLEKNVPASQSSNMTPSAKKKIAKSSSHSVVLRSLPPALAPRVSSKSITFSSRLEPRPPNKGAVSDNSGASWSSSSEKENDKAACKRDTAVRLQSLKGKHTTFVVEKEARLSDWEIQNLDNSRSQPAETTPLKAKRRLYASQKMSKIYDDDQGIVYQKTPEPLSGDQIRTFEKSPRPCLSDEALGHSLTFLLNRQTHREYPSDQSSSVSHHTSSVTPSSSQSSSSYAMTSSSRANTSSEGSYDLLSTAEKTDARREHSRSNKTYVKAKSAKGGLETGSRDEEVSPGRRRLRRSLSTSLNIISPTPYRPARRPSMSALSSTSNKKSPFVFYCTPRTQSASKLLGLNQQPVSGKTIRKYRTLTTLRSGSAMHDSLRELVLSRCSLKDDSAALASHRDASAEGSSFSRYSAVEDSMEWDSFPFRGAGESLLYDDDQTGDDDDEEEKRDGDEEVKETELNLLSL